MIIPRVKLGDFIVLFKFKNIPNRVLFSSPARLQQDPPEAPPAGPPEALPAGSPRPGGGAFLARFDRLTLVGESQSQPTN